MFSNQEGEEAELLNAVLLRLGQQLLPPTDLGQVDEEMAFPGGRPSQLVCPFNIRATESWPQPVCPYAVRQSAGIVEEVSVHFFRGGCVQNAITSVLLDNLY
ncbi:hypothetical protein TNCV_1767211 [Trichonephila clavipes]|nr:hypothetical protein TNCV_1767211 [Trichonephila clavipes]